MFQSGGLPGSWAVAIGTVENCWRFGEQTGTPLFSWEVARHDPLRLTPFDLGGKQRAASQETDRLFQVHFVDCWFQLWRDLKNKSKTKWKAKCLEQQNDKNEYKLKYITVRFNNSKIVKVHLFQQSNLLSEPQISVVIFNLLEQDI